MQVLPTSSIATKHPSGHPLSEIQTSELKKAWVLAGKNNDDDDDDGIISLADGSFRLQSFNSLSCKLLK